MDSLDIECAVDLRESLKIKRWVLGIEITMYSEYNNASVHLNDDSIKALKEFLNQLPETKSPDQGQG